MNDRVTKDTLNRRTGNLNRRLRDLGGGPDGRHVQWQGRNGHVGLDEYDGTTCVRTLTVGTKREIADFLHAMMVGIDLGYAVEHNV